MCIRDRNKSPSISDGKISQSSYNTHSLLVTKHYTVPCSAVLRLCSIQRNPCSPASVSSYYPHLTADYYYRYLQPICVYSSYRLYHLIRQNNISPEFSNSSSTKKTCDNGLKHTHTRAHSYCTCTTQFKMNSFTSVSYTHLDVYKRQDCNVMVQTH